MNGPLRSMIASVDLSTDVQSSSWLHSLATRSDECHLDGDCQLVCHLQTWADSSGVVMMVDEMVDYGHVFLATRWTTVEP